MSIILIINISKPELREKIYSIRHIYIYFNYEKIILLVKKYS